MYTIKAIIFDFDGVILESAEIKTRAFRKLFESDYPDKVDAIVDYHCNNMGISRYLKFSYIFENILQLPLSGKLEKDLGQKFSDITFDEILKVPFVTGALDFLNENQKKYFLFIASGTPEDELHRILKLRRIDNLFNEANGSPKQKSKIINTLLSNYSLSSSEVVFVGDAESDLRASEETGVHFIARITAESTPQIQKCNWKIHDLTKLGVALKKIDGVGQ